MSNTLAPSTSVTHRDPKGLKFMSIVGAAYDRAKLSEDEAQHVNNMPGLSKAIRKFIVKSRLIDCVDKLDPRSDVSDAFMREMREARLGCITSSLCGETFGSKVTCRVSPTKSLSEMDGDETEDDND